MNYNALIIEDDPIWVEAFEELLRQYKQFGQLEKCVKKVFAIEGWRAYNAEKDDFDVIFLDIGGVKAGTMDSAGFLEALDLKSYSLPVVVITRSRDAQNAVDHWGAHRYWLKEYIPEGLFEPQDKVKKWIESCLKPVMKAVREYKARKPLVFGDMPEAGSVRKECVAIEASVPEQVALLQDLAKREEKELREQAKFLFRVTTRNDFNRVRPHFPHVPKMPPESPPIFYEMPYYPAPSLSKLLLDGYTDASSALWIGKMALERTLEILFDLLYARDIVENVDDSSEPPYFQKYLSRRAEFSTCLEWLPAGRFKADLKSLLGTQFIQVGGDGRLPNLHTVMLQLQSSEGLKRRLRPRMRHRLHGDVHFDNVLVNLPFPDLPRIMLIDPKGYIGDFAIDVAKLLMSAHGEYDFLRTHVWRTLSSEDGFAHVNGDVCSVGEWEFSSYEAVEESSGATLARVTRRFYAVTPEKRDNFKELHAHLIRWIRKNGNVKDDPDWEFRSYFGEVLNFANVASNYAFRGANRLVAADHAGSEKAGNFIRLEKKKALDVLSCARDCYIRATELMAQLVARYGEDLSKNVGEPFCVTPPKSQD